MRYIFIRHGEPDYSNDSLTEKGRREAEALAERIKDWNIKDIYLSPLGRAVETAEPSLKILKREGITLPWLREFSYLCENPTHGRMAVPWDFIPSHLYEDERMISMDEWIDVVPMCNNPAIRENYPKVIAGIDELTEKYGYLRNGKYYVRKDGRERFIKSTVKDEKIPAVDFLPEDDSEPTIVMFCHLGVICLMMSRLLNVPFELLTHSFFIPTTSVTIVNTEERWGKEVSFRAQVVGDVTHLHDAGEAISNAGSFTRLFQQ